MYEETEGLILSFVIGKSDKTEKESKLGHNLLFGASLLKVGARK